MYRIKIGYKADGSYGSRGGSGKTIGEAVRNALQHFVSYVKKASFEVLSLEENGKIVPGSNAGALEKDIEESLMRTSIKDWDAIAEKVSELQAIRRDRESFGPLRAKIIRRIEAVVDQEDNPGRLDFDPDLDKSAPSPMDMLAAMNLENREEIIGMLESMHLDYHKKMASQLEERKRFQALMKECSTTQ